MSESVWQNKWTPDEIRTILTDQFASFWQRETGIERDKLADIQSAAQLPHAVVISGLRRVGKSTLLSQLAHHLGEDQFYYLNFEDERFLGFQADDFNDLYRFLIELYGRRTTFIIDEIQNIPEWERFVRRFIDTGVKFYITGSNASLLSRELGNRLTGRYIPIELFPFSFAEYLRFRDFPLPTFEQPTTIESGLLQQQLSEYMRLGGIPEPLKYPELPLLRTLYDDVLYRDIATRYRVEDVRALKELAFYLVSNAASLISYNRLKEQLKLGSVNTIKNYIDFLENSWLFFSLNVYDFSVKRQQIAPKKVYCIDTGLAHAVGFSFSKNSGKLLENLVFLALRRKAQDIYYLTSRQGFEVDFYLPETRQLIQVTQSMNSAATRAREVRAILQTMQEMNLTEGLILAEANYPAVSEAGRNVEIRWMAEWLIQNG